MSEFEARVQAARRRSLRRWARGLRYAGDFGAAVLGAAGLWLFIVVVLA